MEFFDDIDNLAEPFWNIEDSKTTPKNNLTQFSLHYPHEVAMSLDKLPLFVKGGTILPLADPVQYVDENTKFNLVCRVYGQPTGVFSLFEDDGISYDFEREKRYNWVYLQVKDKKGKSTREGTYKKQRYHIKEWKFID